MVESPDLLGVRGRQMGSIEVAGWLVMTAVPVVCSVEFAMTSTKASHEMPLGARIPQMGEQYWAGPVGTSTGHGWQATHSNLGPESHRASPGRASGR
jgi:hypothetical protein